MTSIIIYSDGGADPNPGIGGWAAILRYGEHEKVLTGNDPKTTNNRMELQAAVSALSALKRPSTIEFHTDSQYLRQGITKWIGGWAERGWQHKDGRAIPNADLWQTLWLLVKQHEINWHWVKGHAGDPLNERVDQLAREARLAITPRLELDDALPQLYVRASCKGNPGPGGWAVVISWNGVTRTISGGELRTTNNRMEVQAAVAALQSISPGAPAQIITASDYLFQGATQWLAGWQKRGWQKKDGQPISNADLWQQLAALLTERPTQLFNAKSVAANDAHLAEAAALAQSAASTQSTA
jgi:ribonuclease HI